MVEIFLIAITLTVSPPNGGYCYCGEPVTFAVSSDQKPALDCQLDWSVTASGAELTHGQSAAPTESAPAQLAMEVPSVRTPTTLTLKCKLRTPNGPPLAESECRVVCYPRDALSNTQRRLDNKSLLICDSTGAIPKLLAGAQIKHDGVKEITNLPLRAYDLVVVAPNQLDAAPLTAAALLGRAESGASVFLFIQSTPTRVLTYAVANRRCPPNLEWDRDHMLFTDMDEALLRTLTPTASDVRALCLPANEPALELAFIPRETPGDSPVPIDALICTKSVGAGRIVLCQLPITEFEHDPRATLLLRNVLEYLATRPEPTPPPSARTRPSVRPAPQSPEIRISPGGNP